MLFFYHSVFITFNAVQIRKTFMAKKKNVILLFNLNKAVDA